MEKLRLQKLLFLFAQGQDKPAYHFLPYKYGCYSFQAAEDARILAGHYAMLIEKEHQYLLNNGKVTEEHLSLKDEDCDRLDILFGEYEHLNKNELIYRVYEQYPRYAVNSELLNQPHLYSLRGAIEQKRKKFSPSRRALFTIGYEGKSIEHYVNCLIENGIAMLIDVRHNPFSMKYGFSKKQLRHITGECKIDYCHIPELGIEGTARKHLVSTGEYRHLFANYRASLPEKTKALQRIQAMLDKHKRVALTCFEKDHLCCHRNALAEVISAQSGLMVRNL